MNYTLFIDDMKDRIKEYNDSFKEESGEGCYPKKQREIWAPINRYNAITQKIMGCDSEGCLRLLEECGYDGEPVCSQTASSIRKWFELTNGHTFPPQRDVLRLAIFLCFDFYETLHFVLKSDFEKFLIESDPNWNYLSGDSYIDIITRYNSEGKKDELEKKIQGYHKSLDYNTLHLLFEEHWQMASSTGYSQRNFKTLVDDLFRERLLFYENTSEKIGNFSRYQQELIEQTRFGTPEEQDVLWQCRGRWQTLQDSLDEIHIEIENKRLIQAETEQEYLRLFGELTIRQTELETEIKLLEMRIGFLRINPGMTEEEIREKIRETQNKLEKEIEDLRLMSAIAKESAVMEAWRKIGVPMDPAELDEEKCLCKSEVQAIRKLVHPDVLMHNKVYQSLNEEQKKELEEIMLDAMRIQPSELGYPPNFAHHDMRSLEGLRQVRRRIEIILEMNNIHIDLEYQIEGETIAEQITWLEREIIRLENRISAAKGQLTAMLMDPEIQSKIMLLGNLDKQKLFREQMEEKISLLESKRDLKCKELEELRIHQLEQEITRLESQINAAKGKLKAMLMGSDVQSRKVLIDDPDEQELSREQIEEQISSLESERDVKCKKLKELHIHRLEREIARLEDQISDVKGRLTAMLMDSDVQSKKALTDDHDKQKLSREQMEALISQLESEWDQKCKELEELRKA